MRSTPAKNRAHEAEEEEDHGEELWIVSYADMVTLLFGFFVILYSFSTLDDKKFDQMSEKMAEAFKSKEIRKTSEPALGVSDETRQLRAFQMLVSMMNLGDNADEAIAKIEKSFAEGKTAQGAKALLVDKAAAENKGLVKAVSAGVEDDLQTIELVLPDASLFSPGSYQLTAAATARIKALAGDLRHVADLADIDVEGHTDSQPPATGALYSDNFTLSSLRAGAVAAAMIRFGVDATKVSVKGLGSLKPLLPERQADGRMIPANMAKNRRVNIVLKLRHTHAPTAH